MIGTSGKESSNGVTSAPHLSSGGGSMSSVVTSSPAIGGGRASSKYMIAEDSISILKTLGTGEFGTVQQGVWTTDDGARVQVRARVLAYHD